MVAWLFVEDMDWRGCCRERIAGGWQLVSIGEGVTVSRREESMGGFFSMSRLVLSFDTSDMAKEFLPPPLKLLFLVCYSMGEFSIFILATRIKQNGYSFPIQSLSSSF